jgi:hypothetical protein
LTQKNSKTSRKEGAMKTEYTFPAHFKIDGELVLKNIEESDSGKVMRKETEVLFIGFDVVYTDSTI